MARRSSVSKLLVSAKNLGVKNIAIGLFLCFFVFVGAFLTTSSAVYLFTGRAVLANVCLISCENLGTDGSVIPNIVDARNIGLAPGELTRTRVDGTKVTVPCRLADLNCDGIISTEEWRIWSTLTLDEMRKRCLVLNCYCVNWPGSSQCQSSKPYLISQFDYNLTNSVLDQYAIDTTGEFSVEPFLDNMLWYQWDVQTVPDPGVLSSYGSGFTGGSEGSGWGSGSGWTWGFSSIGSYGYGGGWSWPSGGVVEWKKF